MPQSYTVSGAWHAGAVQLHVGHSLGGRVLLADHPVAVAPPAVPSTIVLSDLP